MELRRALEAARCTVRRPRGGMFCQRTYPWPLKCITNEFSPIRMLAERKALTPPT